MSNHIGADQFKEEGKKGNAFRIESRAERERERERERAHGTAPRLSVYGVILISTQ